MYSVKHREMENLRFRDFEEQRSGLGDEFMKVKYDIVEKHIGMSISLEEKKQALQAHNDKIRHKMAKESARQRSEVGNAGNKYFKVRNDQMSVAAYAPDLVKWTPKDIKKIMQLDKPPGETENWSTITSAT